VKIAFTALCAISDEVIARNEAYAGSLGFPWFGRAGRPRLAIVGGGPSIARKIDALRRWDGDIWAINGAHNWLRDKDINSTFFSIDPKPIVAKCCAGAKRAVLATCCDPSVFDALKGADITAVKIGPGGLENGPTSATTAPVIATEMGYRQLTFFGCESSYGDITHAYHGDVAYGSLLQVACNGESFLTNPAFFMQAEMLAALIREAPSVFKDESGGLLSAMVADPDYDITAASQSIHDGLRAA
jgi:hypothetical protein